MACCRAVWFMWRWPEPYHAARCSTPFYMAFFGLGTLPTMLGISLSGKLFPLAFRLKLRSTIPVGVCLLAGLLILRGLALGIPYVSPALVAGVPASCCVR